MIGRYYLIIISISIFLGSCKEQSMKIETDTAIIEVEETSGFNKDYTNSTREDPLYIDADRIDLKQVFAFLIKTDTSNVLINDSEISGKYYKVLIEQLDDNRSVNNYVVDELLQNFNLELKTEQIKSFEIIIEDSLKYAGYFNEEKKMQKKVTKFKDSIHINNFGLADLAELLNLEYRESFTFNQQSEKIDYAWKKGSINDLRTHLEEELGITFKDLNSDKFVYSLSKKYD